MDELNAETTEHSGAIAPQAPRSPQSLMPCDLCCHALVNALPTNQTPAVYCPHRQTVAMIQQRAILLQPADTRADAVKIVATILKATALGQGIADAILLHIAQPSADEKPN